MKKIIAIGLLVLLSLGGIFGIMKWSLNDSEVSLRASTEAQQKVCETSFDKMWKVLSTQASVPEQYKNAMKEIYIPIMEGRYGNEKGGTLMKWIQEHNPTFDASLYKNLMTSIEAERASFFMEQKKLIDLDREHKTLRRKALFALIFAERPDVGIKIITSTKTENAYKTGKEDDINLFDKR